MTSQKSLKNNVNLNDFKRSLIGSLTFPLIAFVVLFLSITVPVIDYVTSDEFIANPVHDEIQMFMTDYSLLDASLLFSGMFFCGLLTAAKSFYFLVSKKQVNVFLSQGVTRNTMFVNRIISGTITLFISTLVPVLIVYFINIDKFGISAHLTSTFIYFVSGLFVSGLAGLSMGAFSMMIAGNIFEAGLTATAISVTPIMITNVVLTIRGYFLKGFYSDYSTYSIGYNQEVLLPFAFTNVYKNYYGPHYVTSVSTSTLLGVINKDMLVDGKIPEAYNFDSTFIIPVVLWFVVSIVLTVLAFVLFNKRKAEHANSFGHFSVSRAICSICVFTFAVYFAVDALYYALGNANAILMILGCAVIGLLAFFLTQLIMARKLKTVLKSLPICAVLISVVALGFVTAETGIFGQYNKTPVKEDVKSVSISFVEIPMFQNIIGSGHEYVKSVNTKDIDMVIELFDEIKQEKKIKGEFKARVAFAFEDENGKAKFREFAIYSDDLYVKYLKEFCNSDYFDAITEEKLLGFSDKDVSVDGKYFLNKVIDYSQIEYEIGVTEETDAISVWHYTDNQMIITRSANGWEDYSSTAQRMYKGDELATALYNDITKMTFEDFFKNNSRPLALMTVNLSAVCANANDTLKPSVNEYDKYHGGLNISEEYFDDYTKYYINGEYVGTDLSKVMVNYIVEPLLRIYPQMTETVKYFKDNGFEFEAQYKGEIKEVLYTNSPITFDDAFVKYAQVNQSRFNEVQFSADYEIFETNYFSADSFDSLMDFISEDVKYYDIFKSVYKTAEYSLLTLNNTKIDEVLSKCVPYYLVNNDNGRYVYVVYEDGSMVCHYLPEANVGVLK